MATEGAGAESREEAALRKWDRRLMFVRKWVGIFVMGLVQVGGAVGLVYCLRHIFENVGQEGIGHLLVVGLFGVIFAGVAGGKRTIAATEPIVAGIAAYMSGKRKEEKEEEEENPFGRA